MNKLKKGDKVVVIAGKDKGKTGVITQVIDAGEYFVVEGVNLVTKNTKANPSMNTPGGQAQKPMPIHRSNVMYWDENTQQGSRVGKKILEDGSKARFLKKTNQVLEDKK